MLLPNPPGAYSDVAQPVGSQSSTTNRRAGGSLPSWDGQSMVAMVGLHRCRLGVGVRS